MEVAGLIVALIVDFFDIEIFVVCLLLGSEVLAVVVEGLLNMVNGVTFGLVNVGCELGVTG